MMLAVSIIGLLLFYAPLPIMLFFTLAVVLISVLIVRRLNRHPVKSISVPRIKLYFDSSEYRPLCQRYAQTYDFLRAVCPLCVASEELVYVKPVTAVNSSPLEQQERALIEVMIDSLQRLEDFISRSLLPQATGTMSNSGIEVMRPYSIEAPSAVDIDSAHTFINQPAGMMGKHREWNIQQREQAVLREEYDTYEMLTSRYRSISRYVIWLQSLREQKQASPEDYPETIALQVFSWHRFRSRIELLGQTKKPLSITDDSRNSMLPAQLFWESYQLIMASTAGPR